MPEFGPLPAALVCRSTRCSQPTGSACDASEFSGVGALPLFKYFSGLRSVW